jgi:hypothetical protein
MKRLLRLLVPGLVICNANCAFAQQGEWTWMHGSNATGSMGNYGIQGVPDSLNEPEAFYEPAEWTDLNGNFWLFSGWNPANAYNNDLWKYDPVTNEWTWMKGNGIVNDAGSYGVKGVPSASNLPHARTFGCITWTDLNNNLWLFGGNYLGTMTFNDLWKYDIVANEWTWMSGDSLPGQPGVYGTRGLSNPANYPGARFETTAGWTDVHGNLWLFGGAYSNNCRNDLWRYHIGNNEWTWMKGDSVPGAAPVYGAQMVEDTSNDPGARIVYATWKDQAGDLWLFGSGNYYLNQIRNDLWKYTVTTNNWTWMNGSNLAMQTGTYGTQCITAPANTPGYRLENRVHWTDIRGNFWMMGGGYGSQHYTWNDLWMYCVYSNEWKWVDGSVTQNPAGTWGSRGISAPANTPDGRCGGVGWEDQSGNLYFFGGTNNGFLQFYNDLWRYAIDTLCAYQDCPGLLIVPGFYSASSVVCPGSCVDFTNLSVGASSYQWIFPGGTPAVSTDVNPASICYNTPGSYDVTLIATGAGGTDTLTLTNYITVYSYPPPQAILQNGDTLIANQGALTYQWYYGGNSISGATGYFYIATQSGNYNVVCTDSNNCEVEAAIFDVIASVQTDESGNCIIRNQAFPNELVLLCGKSFISRIEIYNVLGELQRWQKKPMAQIKHAGDEIHIDISTIAPGIYFVLMESEHGIASNKFIKE